MPSRDSVRILWKASQGYESRPQHESLDAFQRRMEPLCANRRDILPYEKKMFDEGWMFIEWTRYPFAYNKQARKLRTPLGQMLYQALENGERIYNFERSEREWTGSDLVKGVREITSQLNARMSQFLEKFRGDKLLLSAWAHRGYGETQDWELNAGDISWFLKRPNY